MTDFELTPKQEKALAALLIASSIAEAARISGVSERSIFRYVRDYQFRSEYKSVIEQVANLTVSKLQKDALQATAVLTQISQNTEASASDRINASKAILNAALNSGF